MVSLKGVLETRIGGKGCPSMLRARWLAWRHPDELVIRHLSFGNFLTRIKGVPFGNGTIRMRIMEESDAFKP